MQPTPTAPNVKQVPLLTASQIAQFKRDGFLVLPSVLDPELCRQARDAMWRDCNPPAPHEAQRSLHLDPLTEKKAPS